MMKLIVNEEKIEGRTRMMMHLSRFLLFVPIVSSFDFGFEVGSNIHYIKDTGYNYKVRYTWIHGDRYDDGYIIIPYNIMDDIMDIIKDINPKEFDISLLDGVLTIYIMEYNKKGFRCISDEYEYKMNCSVSDEFIIHRITPEQFFSVFI